MYSNSQIARAVRGALEKATPMTPDEIQAAHAAYNQAAAAWDKAYVGMLDTNIAIELASNATTRKAHASALAAYQAANKRLNAVPLVGGRARRGMGRLMRGGKT